MRRPRTLLPLSFTFIVIGLLHTGCAGPDKLRRGLDESYNGSYMKNPALSQLLLPFYIVGSWGAAALDYVILNPYSFWGDAPKGTGVPYRYKNNAWAEYVGRYGSEPGPLASTESRPATYYEPPPSSYSPSYTPPIPSNLNPGRSTYKVERGDTLRSISMKVYGTTDRWKDIYRKNSDVLTNPNRIYPNTTLRLP